MTTDGTGSSIPFCQGADGHVLQAYLSLEEPRLTLDVRPDAVFHQAHLANSYHIHPVSGLKSCYSYLPPSNVPFLVLADYAQLQEVLQAFDSTPSARLIFLLSSTLAGPVERGQVLNTAAFFDSARQLGLVQTSQSQRERHVGNARHTDVPELLFRPSNAVRRTVLQLEHDHNVRCGLRVLDLGCGAARDLAWILHGSRKRSASTSSSQIWTGVGVDNWKAALVRAHQLMTDLYLHPSQQDASQPSLNTCCENLLWAKCTDDGSLQPLVGTGKGKSITTTGASDINLPLVNDCNQLGLGPLLPDSLTFEQVVNAENRFDLILSIRFHPRALLPRLSQLVRTGGVVLLSHFVSLTHAEEQAAKQAHPNAVTDYESPPHEGRIQPGEVEALIGAWNARAEPRCKWIIAEQVLEPIEDGRIVKSVALRKLRS